ncbi:hypothetical protein OIU77_031458 [Salix suchowensis]|uniref:Uncharacterized protein n=1 Tax=Salix suchowensis TaxID=1278906 RepID=A0ABQ9BHQ1_9ROSI|nr:hypothetical protein OIU77_031458 [Salix suchowensis]
MSIHFSCFHGSPKCDRAVLNIVVLPLKSCHLVLSAQKTEVSLFFPVLDRILALVLGLLLSFL